jgi:signal transduction histidine kinase
MPTGLRGWMAAHPQLVDALIAVVIFVLSLMAVPASPDRVGLDPPEVTPLGLACLAVACVALLWRRTHPVQAWAVALVATMVTLPTGAAGQGLPAAVAALYAIAAYGTRRAAVIAASVTMVGVLLLLSQSSVITAADPVTYAVVAWCGFAAALGDAVRSSRALLAQALERARLAEQDRDAEAARQVAEERVRISRELHDVVAHHVAVVNVQAGVAEHLVDTDAAAARQALERVRSASGAALREMGAIVGLLRTDGEPDDPASGSVRPPAPGAGQVPGLVEALRDGGVDVSWHHEGPALGGTPGEDLHLYRIVQEALTNAARHGTGTVVLRTRQDRDAVTIEVLNPVDPARPRPGTSGGHGLVGMRERVAVVGGDIDVTSAEGTYRVRVRLPLEEPA